MVSSLIRHILLISSPLAGGITLIAAAPIALAQAAIAVHTTKLTGRMAAKEFLNSNLQKGFQPRLMLFRLARKDPGVQQLLNQWSGSIVVPSKPNRLRSLLP